MIADFPLDTLGVFTVVYLYSHVGAIQQITPGVFIFIITPIITNSSINSILLADKVKTLEMMIMLGHRHARPK